MNKIRQPIVTFAGHVDHGKTSILDSIRGTTVAKKEAGGITQKISCTSYPAELINEKCSELFKRYKISLEIPGFLFVDTPGHAAFTNLRKRGGSLADLAILVADINEGVMPQTLESIEILKAAKTPFILALNKIDAIHGWRKHTEDLEKNIGMQQDYVRREFDNKLYRIISALTLEGFDADLFFRVSDFTKKLAVVPCSAKTGEGIAELMLMLCGLSQRFLEKKLQLSSEARGTVLEVKKEKSMLNLEAVLYDGILHAGDEVAIASFNEPIRTKVRAIFEVLPLSRGYAARQEVSAAAGIRMQMTETENIFSGMPFSAIRKDNEKEVLKSLKKEISETINLDDDGIIIKAESLGSLEALLILLRKEGIHVGRASIGNVTKSDVAAAASNAESNPVNAIILGFNVISETGEDERVKILTHEIIYKLIEDFWKWRQDKQAEMQRESLAHLTFPCRIKVLKFIFRQSKPAIFGVHIEAGMLKAGTEMMNSSGEKIGKIRAIQAENKSVETASKAKDIAVSMQNVTYGRQVKEGDTLYPNLSEEEFVKLKQNKQYLSSDEISILQEIARIKREGKATWGI